MIKNSFKNILKNIDKIILIIILIISTIISRMFSQYSKLLILTNVVMIIYFVIRIIAKKPIRLIKTKLDIFVLIFTVSSMVPLLSNTYISLYATMTTILMYLTLFWVYILTREMGESSNRFIHIFLNCIIILTIVLIIVGIENLTTNKIFEFFKIEYIINGEDRLVSIFGNPNTFAILIVLSYFLSVSEMQNSKNDTLKNIYSTINSILITGLVLTYSKASILVFGFMLIMYMISVRNKTQNIYLIQNTILSAVLAVIYVYIFQKFAIVENYITILIFSIIWIIFSVLLNLINIKLLIYTEKIKLKNIIILGIVITLIFGIVVKIELTKGKEFAVFARNSSSNYNAKKIKNIKPNTDYKFSFDMDASMNFSNIRETTDDFAINIIQRDSKNLEITNYEEQFGEFHGIKDIEIKTAENTSEIKIEFKSKYKYSEKTWTINNLKINNEDIILEYKHLPTKLVEKIQDININYKTAQERFQFIKDGIKIIKKNFITGIGGDGWRYKYEEVQDYGYVSNDTHSYFTQIWIEFGILGIIGIISIIITIILKKDNEFRGVKFAILALLLHSLIDSDMYTLHMKLMLFILFGIISITKNNLPIEKIKLYNIINITLIIIPVFTIILYKKPQIYDKNFAIISLRNQQTGLYIDSEEYKQLYKKLEIAYADLLKYERDMSTYTEYIVKRIDAYIKSGQEDVEDIIKQYYEKISNYHDDSKFSAKKIVQKSKSIDEVLDLIQFEENPKLYPCVLKLSKLNIDEFEETKNTLENAIRSKYKENDETDDDKKELDKLYHNYERELQIYNTYYYGIKINNTTDVDVKQYVSNDEKLNIDNKNDIIIYHTHTTEAYNSLEEILPYDPTEYGKTLNEQYNILNVGNILEENLKNKGFNIIHLENYNDLEGIHGAYDRSYDALQSTLQSSSTDIQLVFDVHRDAYMEHADEENIIQINNEKVAKIRFVIAIGHDGWENNLKWAIELQKKADELYPGLFKPMYIYDRNFNQSATKYATLIEVGNEVDTIEEAQRSMIYFSDVIEKTLN